MTEKKIKRFAKQAGIALSEILAILGLIVTLRQLIPAANRLEKVVVGLCIAALFVHLVQRSPWTITWSKVTKLLVGLLVLPFIAWSVWESEQHVPDISIQGALPIHLWEKVPGPESVTYVDHRLGFIVKLHNNSDAAAMVDFATLEGCVKIPLLAAENMLIEGEALPKPLKLDKTDADLQQSTIQAIRTSGAIREDSREVKAFGTAYIGVLFSLPPGRTGAIFGAPRSASIKGDCKAITNPSKQPSISQLLEIGALQYEFPRDIAPQFRDGRLKLQLHVGDEIFDLAPSTFGKLHSLQWERWSSLSLAQMYEVPDSDYPPYSD